MSKKTVELVGKSYLSVRKKMMLLKSENDDKKARHVLVIYY